MGRSPPKFTRGLPTELGGAVPRFDAALTPRARVVHKHRWLNVRWPNPYAPLKTNKGGGDEPDGCLPRQGPPVYRATGRTGGRADRGRPFDAQGSDRQRARRG